MHSVVDVQQVSPFNEMGAIQKSFLETEGECEAGSIEKQYSLL